MADKQEKSPYFSLDEEMEALKMPYDAKEFAVSGLKALGKGIMNVGIFAAKEVVPRAPNGIEAGMKAVIKEYEKKLENENLSSDQKQIFRQKLAEAKQRLADFRAIRK